jgi:hypothetical protein
MSFLESLGLDVIKSEKDMLRALRDATEGWYNELTQPFLPVFLAHESYVPGEEERTRLAKLANDMLCAELLINRGDALENKLAEIEKSSGIPLFSGRKELRIKTVVFLESGVFLKKIAYGQFKKAATADGYRAAVREARTRWQDFQTAKGELVAQINGQLARIG